MTLQALDYWKWTRDCLCHQDSEVDDHIHYSFCQKTSQILKILSKYVTCNRHHNQSFLELQNSSGVATSTSIEVIDRSVGSKSTIQSSKCGRSFGHGLIFSKTLEMINTNISLRQSRLLLMGRGCTRTRRVGILVVGFQYWNKTLGLEETRREQGRTGRDISGPSRAG